MVILDGIHLLILRILLILKNILSKGWIGMRIRWSKFQKYNNEEKEYLLNEIRKFLNMN